ncbi:hypothetical protein GCM10010236_74760 [Streptomyces eurythermus]|nr:hypothetical protein GCM10010236_74760 [Streptomyces eurythermus]
MHDHPAGRQLRHARTYLPYRADQSHRRVTVADITSCAGPVSPIDAAEKHRPGVRPLVLGAVRRRVPRDGTSSKIFSRLAGVCGAFTSDRGLPTGALVHGRWMTAITFSVWAGR